MLRALLTARFAVHRGVWMFAGSEVTRPAASRFPKKQFRGVAEFGSSPTVAMSLLVY